MFVYFKIVLYLDVMQMKEEEEEERKEDYVIKYI